MSKAKTVDEVLTAVEWMLENVGWSQGRSYRDAHGMPLDSGGVDISKIGSMCLVGAINLVEVENREILSRAARLLNTVNHGIVVFNDYPGRTKEEVIAGIRKARTIGEIVGDSA